MGRTKRGGGAGKGGRGGSEGRKKGRRGKMKGTEKDASGTSTEEGGIPVDAKGAGPAYDGINPSTHRAALPGAFPMKKRDSKTRKKTCEDDNHEGEGESTHTDPEGKVIGPTREGEASNTSPPPNPEQVSRAANLPHMTAIFPDKLRFNTPRTGDSGRPAPRRHFNNASQEREVGSQDSADYPGLPRELNSVFAMETDMTRPNLFGGEGPVLENLAVSATPSALGPRTDHLKGQNPAVLQAYDQAQVSIAGSGDHGVNMGFTTSCTDVQCLTKMNKMNNDHNKLLNELHHAKIAERNANRLKEIAEEELRKVQLNMRELEIKFGSSKLSKTVKKRNLPDDIDADDMFVKVKKRKARPSVALKRQGERGIMPSTTPNLGILAVQARQDLVAAEVRDPHEGFISTLGDLLLGTFCQSIVEGTIRGCTESFVRPWNEEILYSPVMGFYPKHVDLLKWESNRNPEAAVCALPPEPVTGGLGSASMGYINGGIPTVPGSLYLSDSDVGMVDSSLIPNDSNKTIIGFQMRTVVETCRAYILDCHAWHAFSPEFDAKGMNKVANAVREEPLSVQRYVSRAVRSLLASDQVDIDELREKVQTWKDKKIALTREGSNVPQGTKTATDLGLSPGDDASDHDLDVFIRGLTNALIESSSLAAYLMKAAQNGHCNHRKEFQQGFLEDIGAFEYDRRLGSRKFFQQRNEDARKSRYETLHGNAKKGIEANVELCRQYKNLAKCDDGLNCGHIVIDAGAKKGRKYKPATTFVLWKGDGSGKSNGWRRHTNESCLAFNKGPQCDTFGFKKGDDPLPLEDLLDAEYWDNHWALPTETTPRPPGPLVDELFRTTEARMRMIKLMRRSPKKINIMKELPDFEDLWSVQETDLTKAEIGVVRRIIGDNTLRWIVVADAEIATCLHARMCELLYGIRMGSSQHGILFRNLLVPFCLNLSLELWDICTKIPSFNGIEIKMPFDFAVATKWSENRIAAGKSACLLPVDGEDEESSDLMETRADFARNVPQMLPKEVHGHSYYMENGRNMTFAYWSVIEKIDLLVLTPEFFTAYICSWFGIVRDAHIGFYDPRTPFTGSFHPLWEKYRHEPAWDIGNTRMSLTHSSEDSQSHKSGVDNTPGTGVSGQDHPNSVAPVVPTTTPRTEGVPGGEKGPNPSSKGKLPPKSMFDGAAPEISSDHPKNEDVTGKVSDDDDAGDDNLMKGLRRSNRDDVRSAEAEKARSTSESRSPKKPVTPTRKRKRGGRSSVTRFSPRLSREGRARETEEAEETCTEIRKSSRPRAHKERR